MISTAAISEMSVKDRLILIEEIWGTLLDKANSEIESPEWHGEILKDRQRKIKEGKATYLTIDELKTNS
jgi:putative addiction module component (TIGR02574 family)